MSQENSELKVKAEKPILIFVWYNAKRGLLNNRLCPFRHNVEYHARLGYQCIVVFYVENEADLSLSNEQFLLRAVNKSDPMTTRTTTRTRTKATTTTPTTTETSSSAPSGHRSKVVLSKANSSTTGFVDKLRLNLFGADKNKIAEEYNCVEANKTKKIVHKKSTEQRSDFSSPSTSSRNEFINQMCKFMVVVYFITWNKN